MGNLKTITDQYSALTYSYDNQNRSISIDTTGTPNLPVVLLSQTYDANSNVKNSPIQDIHPLGLAPATGNEKLGWGLPHIAKPTSVELP